MLNKYINIYFLNKIMCLINLNLRISYNLNKKKRYSNISRLNIIPIVSYNNIEKDKFVISKILKENKQKTGIYRWTNIITGDSYIGSATDLSKRLNDYLKISFLNKELKKGRSIIYSALLKYGYSKFKLDILEYCQLIDLIKREQYYIDNLNPKYNILRVAGSSFGFKHSKATKEILREKSMGRLHLKTTLNKISLNNSMSIPVIIKNIESGIVMEFSNITKASKYIGILPYHFRYYLDRQPIKGKYLIVKINNEDLIVKSKKLVNSNVKGLIVTNNDTGISIEFSYYTKAAEFIGTDRTYLSRSIAKKGFYKGHGFTVKVKKE
jgi:group I intron endonuclease